MVLAGLTFGVTSSSSVLGCSPSPQAGRAAPRASSSSASLSCRLSLGGPASWTYPRSSSSVLLSRPKGRPRELPLPLSQWEGALLPPTPSLQSSQQAAPPLVVLGGLTLLQRSSSTITGRSPGHWPGGAGGRAVPLWSSLAASRWRSVA